MCKAMIDLKNILAFRFTYWLSTSPKERLPVGVFYDFRLFRKSSSRLPNPLGTQKMGFPDGGPAACIRIDPRDEKIQPPTEG
nr:hypothetical protein [Bacillaceae bacterium]